MYLPADGKERTKKKKKNEKKRKDQKNANLQGKAKRRIIVLAGEA